MTNKAKPEQTDNEKSNIEHKDKNAKQTNKYPENNGDYNDLLKAIQKIKYAGNLKVASLNCKGIMEKNKKRD